jgi:RNA polymerase sigma factor (sigma-70 family)
MASGQLSLVLGHLRRLLGGATPDALSDGDLLDRFICHRDESAFAGLLERHGPMVLGLCRCILRDNHEAEDAFQATFLVLAQRGRSIRKQQSLASWLYGVAHRIALRAKTRAIRRRALERQVQPMPPTAPDAQLDDREQQVVLHEELQRLPEKYRAPLVLCYLQGKTHEQAARELGWSRGSMAERLASARERLRRRVEGRGVVLSAGLLAVVAGNASAVPPQLGEGTLRAALGCLASGPVGVSAEAMALAQGMNRTLALAPWKLLAAALLSVSALGVGAAALVYRAPVPNINTPSVAQIPMPAESSPAKAISKAPPPPVEGDPDDPVAEGRPLSQWVLVLRDDDVLTREEAIAVLAQLGPRARPAIPFLQDVLKDDHPLLRIKAADALWKIARDLRSAAPVLRAAMDDPNAAVRGEAVTRVPTAGPLARELAPALVGRLSDPGRPLRQSVVWKLQYIGSPAVPALAEALSHPDVEVRQQAIVILTAIGPAGRDAAPALTRRLEDDDRRVRMAAAQALWAVTHQADKVAPAVADALASRDVSIRRTAATALVSVDPKPESVIPALVAALKDDDELTRIKVAESLWSTGRRGEAELAIFVAALQGPDRPAQTHALSVLSHVASPEARVLIPPLVQRVGGNAGPAEIALGRIGQDAIPALLKAAADDYPRCGVAAARAIGAMGRPAVAPLLRATADPNANVRLVAYQALGSVGAVSREVPPVLARAVKDDNLAIRQAAIRSLGEIGPEARDAVSALLDVLKNGDAGLRLQALTALAETRPDTKTIRPALVAALKDDNLPNRVRAAELLAQVDPAATESGAVLAELLQGEDRGARAKAMEALSKLGPAAAPAVPSLAALLKDTELTARLPIVQALGKIGPAAKPAVPALVEALRSAKSAPNPVNPDLYGVRRGVFVALGEIGPAAREAVPALLEALKDPSIMIRIGAAEALARVDPEQASRAAVPVLQTDLKDPSTWMRIRAADVLIRIGPEQARPAGPVLADLLQDHDANFLQAAVLLWKIDRANPHTLPSLLEALSNKSLHRTEEGAAALGQMGADARPAIPALTEMLQGS